MPTPDWIDPDGGPSSDDDLDPDIHPDPTADDPPWGDDEINDLDDPDDAPDDPSPED